jgi:hypothetical protein
MRVEVDFASLRKTKWHEYAIRFAFGGAVTAIAGMIASRFGPVVGGLFLACPAIFPASATLIDKHEKQKKEKLGLKGDDRGKEAASVDATGSAMGSVGLLAFAFLCWKLLPEHAAGIVLAVSILCWLLVSVGVWHIRKRDQLLKFWAVKRNR